MIVLFLEKLFEVQPRFGFALTNQSPVPLEPILRSFMGPGCVSLFPLRARHLEVRALSSPRCVWSVAPGLHSTEAT